MRKLRWLIVPALFLAGCHGKKSQPKEPEPIVADKPKPKKPPPPPPVCVRAGETMSLVGMVEADAANVSFCVSDGAESNKCYGVDLDSSKYSELDAAPTGQSNVLDPEPARIETTAKEVTVCKGDVCKTFKPKVPRSENPIDAVTNSAGTYVAILTGNAEKGKGTVDVYSVAKPKKAVVTIKYAKGDYKCGEARMLGDTVYVSASVCAGPAARGYLYSVKGKGKKLADVGGKEFGTYGAVPVQLSDTSWAFLEETGSAVAIQDVVTGAVASTIDIGSVWGGGGGGGGELDEGEEAAPPAMGYPGESAMVRGGEGQLVVVTGGPGPGSVAVIDTAGGTVAKSVSSLVCEPEAAPPEEEAASDDAPAEDELSEDADQGGE